jgi:hypothetical protein
MHMKYLIFLLLLISSLANSQTWDFDVSMDGKHIGDHQFVLTNKENNQQLLKSEAKFNVKFLTINVFNYHHKADEVWENNCLKKLESNTKENSKTTTVKAYEDKSLFKVSAQKPLEIDTECVMTFAYWNPKILQQKKLLNPQTGEYLSAQIAFVGKEVINVKGEAVKADHYKIDTSKFKIDIWYGLDGQWLALQSLTSDGRIDYALK